MSVSMLIYSSHRFSLSLWLDKKDKFSYLKKCTFVANMYNINQKGAYMYDFIHLLVTEETLRSQQVKHGRKQ